MPDFLTAATPAIPTPSSLSKLAHRVWAARGLTSGALWPVSLLARAGVAARASLYQRGYLESVRMQVPVIVVGNVFIGGTGKTPFTIWLVQQLQSLGFYPGVVCNGYRGNQDGVQIVAIDSDPREVGDEAVLIAACGACPVASGRDRVAAAQALLDADRRIDVLICDDGLQHYRLQRDIEIVVQDERGNGNGWLLPAGPLREPAGRRRDFTVLHGKHPATAGDAQSAAMRLESTTAISLADPTRQFPLSSIAVSSRAPHPVLVMAAAGIGNPQRFFSSLREAGIVFSEMPLPDHFPYDVNPFAKVQADLILITEKDAVKCARRRDIAGDPRLLAIPTRTVVSPDLSTQIAQRLRLIARAP